MPTVHYLAYGSNLHPLRLRARVPSARVLGVVAMDGFVLAFHKRGRDGSGKCLLYADAAAPGKIHGVLYEFDAGHKGALDAIEGSGNGYAEAVARVRLNGRRYAPYLYMAEPGHVDPDLVPYRWYRDLVVAGARYHALPADYVASIAATPAREDPDAGRAREHEDLLRRCQTHADQG